MPRSISLTRRSFSLLLAGWSAASVIPTHGQTGEIALWQGESIRLGYANEAPYAYIDATGQITGEAALVAGFVLRRLGYSKIIGVHTQFGSLIPGLRAQRFDLVAAGMFLNFKRCEQVLFSEPSFQMDQALLVPVGNPRKLADLTTMARDPNLRLAVVARAMEIEYALLAGLSRNQLIFVPDQTYLATAVGAGRADAAATTTASATYLAEQNDQVEVGPSYDRIRGRSAVGHGGFAFRKQDAPLEAAFSAELQRFLGTPEHAALVRPFGFTPRHLPTLTTAQLCTPRSK